MSPDAFDPADPELRATEIFLITETGRPVCDEVGRPLFFATQAYAEVFSARLLALGLQGVSYRPLRLAPDAGDVLTGLGLDADAFTLIEAQATSRQDFAVWLAHLARRAAAHRAPATEVE